LLVVTVAVEVLILTSFLAVQICIATSLTSDGVPSVATVNQKLHFSPAEH